MAAAVDYLEGVGLDRIHDHELALTRMAVARLSEIDGLRILGPTDPTDRAGVIPFVVDGTTAQDVATLLDSEGIAVRAGHHCAQLVVDRFGLTATTRASVYLYNTVSEVERLAEAVEMAANMLRG